jgi:hypothetical protein
VSLWSLAGLISLCYLLLVENRSRSLNTAEVPPQAGSPRILYTTRWGTINTIVLNRELHSLAHSYLERVYTQREDRGVHNLKRGN